MIDLTGAKIGDKFDSDNDQYELVMKGRADFVIKGSGDRLYTANGLGRSYCGAVKLISKVDPRPWLKDLPDADLFCDNHWLAYNGELDSWFCFTSEPDAMHQSATGDNGQAVWHLRMFKYLPTITGWQWKDSKISIKELKAWQLANQ